MPIRRLTLGQIMAVTPKIVKKRAEGLSVSVHKSGISVSRVMFRLDATYRVRASGGDKLYKVVIRQYAKKPEDLYAGLGRRHETWMHCTCEWFKFVCEVALTQFGSSSVIRSNGAPPFITNPHFVPMMCKHLAAVSLVNPRLNLEGTGPGKFESPEQKKRREETKKHAESLTVTTDSRGKPMITQKESKKVDEEIDKLI